MRDKLILDVGCGAGRFTDVAAANGATVVACDISGAVEACQQNTRTHGSAVHVVQASVYALPFREGIFDAAFCLGVIQHTPDPSVTIDTIPRYLTPGGLLAYDFYERTHWERHWVPHFLLRRFTPSWPARRLLLFAHFLTALFFIPGWILARVPILRNLLPCLPIAMNAQRELSLAGQYRWTVLDTFDWYGPKFELRQHHREVAMRLTRLGLQDVTSRYGVVNARAPERAAAS